MKISTRTLTIILIMISQQALAQTCPYPKKPINWIMRYCAMTVETDDETIIAASPCYQAAAADMLAADTCATNTKYKTKICKEFMMESKRYASLQACLNDKEITPYLPG